MLFAGVSLKGCAMPFDLNLSETPSLTGAVAVTPPHVTPGLYWSWDGSTADGQLTYSVIINLAQHAVSEGNQAALHRVACLYLVTQLDEISVKEAYQSLTDVYQLQQTRDVYIPAFTEPRRLASSERKHLGRLW
jgi:hypothetical protein